MVTERKLPPKITEILREKGLAQLGRRAPALAKPKPVIRELPGPEFETVEGIKSPAGWIITPDFERFISPEGQEFSLAEMQTRLQDTGFTNFIYDYARDMFVPSTYEQVLERELAYEQYPEIVAPGIPGILTPQEYGLRLEQEKIRVESLFQDVFPGIARENIQNTLTEMTKVEGMTDAEIEIAEQNQTDFLQSIQDIGRTPETELLLQTLFPTAMAEDIDSVFGEPSFPETPIAITEQGIDVAVPWWQTAWTSFSRGIVTGFHQTRQALFTVILPNLYPYVREGESRVTGMSDAEAQRKGYVYTAEEATIANQWIEERRSKFREVAIKQEIKHEEFLKKHPELAAKPEYTKDPFQNPELITDPGWWVHTMAETVGTMLPALASGVAVTFATKRPTLGALTTAAVMTPMEMQDLYKDLLEFGAPVERAEELALIVGTAIGAVEVGPSLIFMKAVYPIFKPFRRGLQKAVIKGLMRHMITKGVKNFTAIEVSEALEEVLQGIIHDYTVSWFDENREVLAGIPGTIIRTLVGTLPFAIFGGGMSMRHVPAEVAQTVPDDQKLSQGWTQDTITGEWYRRQLITDIFKEVEEQLIQQGIDANEAKMKALNEIARTPEGERAISQAAKKIEAGVPIEIHAPPTVPEVGNLKTLSEMDNTPEIHKLYPEFDALFTNRNMLVDRLAQLEDRAQGRPSFEKRLDKLFEQREQADADLVAIQRKIASEHPELAYRAIPTAPVEPSPEAVRAPIEPIEGIVPPPPIVPPVTEAVPEAPPPPEGASRRVYDRIQFEEPKVGFKDKILRGWHKFNVKMVDDLFAIKKLIDQLKKGGVELSIEDNPYLMARLLRGIWGKANVFLEKGTFGKQFWKMEKGKAVPNFTGESLETILQEVREPEVWRDLSTYLVSRRTVELSNRDIETGIEIVDANASITEQEIKHPNFNDLAQRLYKYQDSLMVYANEMGLISSDLLGKLRKYGNYVPFYRVFNELQAKGFMGKKMANIAQPVKRIKGSEREIINPLESIVKNSYTIINAADRNQIGIMLANLVDKYPEITEVFERVKTPMARVARVNAKELGVEIEGLSDEDAEAVFDIFRPSFFVRGDEVTVLIDGKKSYFKVDADLRDSLLNLDRENIGMLGKILGAPARWLRAGATLSPDFMIRNPLRDQMTAFAYSNYGFIPGIDFLRGLASIIAKDSDYQLYRMSGAEHAMLVSMDRQYLRKSFKELVEGRGFTAYVKKPMELFRIVSELGEKATRLGEMKAGIRRGAVPLEAGYSSRAVSLDFSQMGTTARAINTLIAFFNANIRGWGRMISSHIEHPVRTSFKIFAGITLPSILLYLANRDDERWKEIPQWQKDLFWIVFTEDNIYRIPKPFELGIIFGSMPERFMEWLDNKDPELFKEALANLLEAGSPGFIPTAGLPILEWMTNYSFFRGYSIVPASRKAMPPELQYTQWTSEVSKKLGELLKLPPAKLDNLIYGYTAGLGRYAVDGLDVILKGTGISPDIPEPSPTLADLPVIKAFVVRNPYGSAGETVERFYKELEEYQAGEKYLKEMLELGEEAKFERYKAAHPELLFLFEFPEDPEKDPIHYSASARYLRRVARDLSELRKKQDKIYQAKDMTPEEKRRLIDEIDRLKTDVARKALDLLMGEVPDILQNNINEAVGKLGEIVEENPPLLEPDIFNMRNLHTEFGNILEAAKREDLIGLEDIDPLSLSYLDVKEVEETIEPIWSKRIYEMIPELKEGVTFEDYYQGWKQGIFEDENLEGLSRDGVELLRQYAKMDKGAQKEFLKLHPELSIDPRDDWLKSNPKENALLAIWGQAKILTKEAYTEFNRLVVELNIPMSGLPEITLPPEGSVDTHFAYLDMVADKKQSSWEAQLLLKKDPDYAEWAGLQISDTPMASLELKTESKFREIYDTIDSYSDKESPKYIEGEEEREQAIAELKATKIIDDYSYSDIERKIKAIEKGTDEIPISNEIVEAHVEYGRLIDQDGIGSGSAEAMLFRVDNSEYNEFRMNEDFWDDPADPIEVSRIPIWRIDAKYREQDAEYDALPTEGDARSNYLEANEEYRKDRRRREAYQKGFADIVEDYVGYYELPVKGYRQERYLFKNPAFAEALGLKVPERVPSEQYDILLEKPTKTSEDELRMAGYLKYVPEQYIGDYVGYYTIIGEGKPEYWKEDTGTDDWYEDDWFFIEHMDFYREVYIKLFGNERKDFSKVPSRAIFDKYLEYLQEDTGKKRQDYRFENLDLDDWLVFSKGYKPIKEQERRKELTPRERMEEDWAERQREIEKRLRALR